ncbi:MAG: EamA family transporter [Actinomycetota bacterium]|nr:EamA family transporter [Actinomycetota bacterium]
MALEVPTPERLAATAAPRPAGLVSIVLLVVSVAFAIAGQLTLKSAMTQIGRIGSAEVHAAGHTASRAIREPRLWAGLALFGISSIFWLVVLSRVPLSVAYPFVGVSYIIIVLLSRYVLHEHVPLLRWLGVVIVATGVAIIGLSFRRLTGS